MIQLIIHFLCFLTEMTHCSLVDFDIIYQVGSGLDDNNLTGALSISSWVIESQPNFMLRASVDFTACCCCGCTQEYDDSTWCLVGLCPSRSPKNQHLDTNDL